MVSGEIMAGPKIGKKKVIPKDLQKVPIRGAIMAAPGQPQSNANDGDWGIHA
jgi:hypothetical protein